MNNNNKIIYLFTQKDPTTDDPQVKDVYSYGVKSKIIQYVYPCLIKKNSLLGKVDNVCNGIELSSGAIRNHQPELMFKAFEIAGYGEDEVRKRFGGMVNAFQFGAPPHGGCAAGIDRIVMLLANQENIREIIMFPMNQRAEDLMMGAPSEPTSDQLMELNLRTISSS